MDDLWLIAGLGNPGKEYAQTRHNIGFMALDQLAKDNGIPVLQKKFDLVFGPGNIDGHPVILCKPLAYMNRSGPPIQQMASYYRITLDHLLVIHDDIDIPLGKLKIKWKGGHGGHNGLKSIIGAFGESAFSRIRIGIGRPSDAMDIVRHVLGRFSRDEERILESSLSKAADAGQWIISKGIVASMNRFNGKETED